MEYCDQFVCLSVVSVCLSASISVELLNQASQNFVCRSPVAVARSSSGGVAIRYVLSVLWMMSCLSVMGCMSMRGRLNLSPNITGVLRYWGRV